MKPLNRTIFLLTGQILILLGSILTNICLSSPTFLFATAMEMWGTFLILNYWAYIIYTKIPPEQTHILNDILARALTAWVIFTTFIQAKVWIDTNLIGKSVLQGYNIYYWSVALLAFLWFLSPLGLYLLKKTKELTFRPFNSINQLF
jgi:hypothetical protein